MNSYWSEGEGDLRNKHQITSVQLVVYIWGHYLKLTIQAIIKGVGDMYMYVGTEQNQSLYPLSVGCVLLLSSVFVCSLQAETAQQTASEKYEHISEVAKQGQWEVSQV